MAASLVLLGATLALLLSLLFALAWTALVARDAGCAACANNAREGFLAADGPTAATAGTAATAATPTASDLIAAATALDAAVASLGTASSQACTILSWVRSGYASDAASSAADSPSPAPSASSNSSSSSSSSSSDSGAAAFDAAYAAARTDASGVITADALECFDDTPAPADDGMAAATVRLQASVVAAQSAAARLAAINAALGFAEPHLSTAVASMPSPDVLAAFPPASPATSSATETFTSCTPAPVPAPPECPPVVAPPSDPVALLAMATTLTAQLTAVANRAAADTTQLGTVTAVVGSATAIDPPPAAS